MARRRNSGISPTQIAIGAIVAIGAGAGVMALSSGGSGDSDKGNFRSFSARSFFDNASSMRGSRLSLEGTVREQIEFARDGGRIYEVDVTEDGRSDSWPVPVYFPPEMRAADVVIGQSYRLTVSVDVDLRIVASAIAPL